MLTLRRLMAMAAILTLLVPIFGPVLDHHFAERQPDHVHIYPPGNDGHHVHFYEQGHSHSHSDRAGGLPSWDQQDQDSGIIYLTSDEGWGQSLTSILVTTRHTNVVYPTPGDNFILPGNSAKDNYPPESFVAPPEKPPRV